MTRTIWTNGPRCCVHILATLALFAGCAAAAAQPAAGLANPASKNCIAKGGMLAIEKNGKGDEFGVCVFEDNRQCEEWALLRGECRAGGIKVTGYVTPAARYCAITGGTYKVTSGSNTAAEQGRCTFRNGRTCGADAYFNGTCTKVAAAPSTEAPASIRALFNCDGGKSIDATFVNAAPSHVDLALSDGRKLSLSQALSADGGRYANASESVVFWNKGNTAFIDEAGKRTFDGCAARR